MNCRRFEELREEYLDGTVSAGEQAAAEAHLADCTPCAEGLRQRREIGRRVANGLQEATHSLRLRPGVERQILRQWAPTPARASSPRPADWFASLLIWRWAAAATFVVAVIWVAGRPAGPPTTKTKAPGAPDDGVVIEVSYRAPVYVFENDGEFVRDSLNYETVTVNTRLGP